MNDALKNISIIFEVETAIKLIEKGLFEVNSISGANDFYDPTFMYLSNGIERLLKAMICMEFRERNSRYPNYEEAIGSKKPPDGHNLTLLIKKTAKFCNHGITIEDSRLLNTDKKIKLILSVLSEYGQKARYFNFDIIMGRNPSYDPKAEWGKLETEFMKSSNKKYFLECIKDPKRLDEHYDQINNIITSKIELFVRALARQFTLGNFSMESKALVSQIRPFLNIQDKDIGNKKYKL